MTASTATIPAGPQYMRALERANQVRLARAELKRKVAVGEVNARDVILECPWEAETMAICDLLTSQRRWGQQRCRRLLASVPISERKEIGKMTERQRRSLAGLLDESPAPHAEPIGASVTPPRRLARRPAASVAA
jgi:hypothetical protein